MKQPIRVGRVVLGLFSALLLTLLGACGGSSAVSVAPAGVALGQGTFLYFYTDD